MIIIFFMVCLTIASEAPITRPFFYYVEIVGTLVWRWKKLEG